MINEKGRPGTAQIAREKAEWLRRLALGLSAQLPDNAEDAKAVLDCVRDLVENFLYPHAAATVMVADGDQDRVLPFAATPAVISNCRTR
jgi:hypothetical protein